MARPRHQDKELERVLRRVEDNGWRVERGKGYFRLLCPCPEKHMRSVSLTPSDPNYGKNLVRWIERQSCWKGSA
jgi:hypothetical protein